MNPSQLVALIIAVLASLTVGYEGGAILGAWLFVMLMGVMLVSEA